jgi:predicted transcriptional regulator
MDSEIIATLIHENEQGNIKNDTLCQENDALNEEIQALNEENQALCQDVRTMAKEVQTLQKENEELCQENELIKRRLADEEEISIVLSKRVELVEQDFRKYVEKMQIYLSYMSEKIQTVHDKEQSYTIERTDTIERSDTIERLPIERSINSYDEILYEKPQLYRSTNLHEWTIDEMIYPLEI